MGRERTGEPMMGGPRKGHPWALSKKPPVARIDHVTLLIKGKSKKYKRLNSFEATHKEFIDKENQGYWANWDGLFQ